MWFVITLAKNTFYGVKNDQICLSYAHCMCYTYLVVIFYNGGPKSDWEVPEGTRTYINM